MLFESFQIVFTPEEQKIRKHALLMMVCGGLLLCLGVLAVAGLFYAMSVNNEIRAAHGPGLELLMLSAFLMVFGAVAITGGVKQRRTGQRNPKVAIVLVVLFVAMLSAMLSSSL